jgi:hypothetical protein
VPHSTGQVTPDGSGVIDSPEEITPEFLTATLSGSEQRVTVAGVRSERIGSGQMAATYRAHLTYVGTPGPASVVVKIGAGDEAARASIKNGYRAEVGFLTKIAPGIDVRIPTCYYGAIADDGTRFTIVMADEVDATVGVQAEGCSEAEAQAAIDNLVGLHAARWADPTLFDHRFFRRPTESMATRVGALCVSAADEFTDRYRDALTGVEQATLVAAAARMGEWMLTRFEPFTVIHGDYRLDNLLFDPSGEVVAVDWQGAIVGPAMRDVAFFLATCVESDQRRATEDALLRRYHSALVDRGVPDYSFEECWDGYRLGMFQGPMVAMTGCVYATGERSDGSDAMFLAMARRSSAAIVDLDVLAMIPA